MEFQNTFEVQAPVEQVWDLLLDVERIAPCMPGAQVLERTGDDTYKVAVKVKLGPMTMNYKGDVEIVDKDPGARRATMRAKAKEARGQGTAAADVSMALEPHDGGTRASILTEMQMSGKAAAMGQGVIRDVAATLTETFAGNLAAMVDEGPGVPAAEAPAPAEAVRAVPPPPAPGAVPPPPRAAAPPPPAPEAEAALPAGAILRSVVAGRLRDPRVAIGLAVLILLTGIAIGRRRG